MATEDTVSSIAKALGETDEIPLAQITGVVSALGEEPSLKLLEETKGIEAKGGMMLPDGSRRRSPGGVFFFLSRQQLSVDDKHRIFRGAPKSTRSPSSEPAPESASPFPRRRVIEVAPQRAPQSAGRNPRPGFLPPELPVAVRRVKVREAIQAALTSLPAEDQYGLLLDCLAELHDRLGYRVPDSQRMPSAFETPTRPGAIVEPPSSQRPIPIPESARVSTSDIPRGDVVEKPKRASAGRAKRS
jgi:hypothetical protein